MDQSQRNALTPQRQVHSSFDMAFPYHKRSPDQCLKEMKVTVEQGLSSEQVLEQREKFGFNELEKEPATPFWKLVLDQFDDALVKILLAAAGVSFALALMEDGDHGISAFVEPLVIIVILVLNAGVGVWQESNAEAALEALKDLQPEECRAVREGVEVTIPARELVPGDIVVVRTGDKVPADLRLLTLHTTTLNVEQAQLTGESTSVGKDIDALDKNDEDVVQAKTNMMFATTVVVNGSGHGLVVSTGMSTEIGEIQKSVQEAAEDEESTPLKQKLDEFGELLSKIIGIICLLVWVINYKNFFDPMHGSVFKGCIYYFKIAVALAVAAIPEGLPAVITTCLALGTRKMAKKNAIVRKLPSVETLGCTSVICSDKTGTLTTNEMCCTVMAHVGRDLEDVLEYGIEGHSFSPEGAVLGAEGAVKNGGGLADFAQVACLCNDSKLEFVKGRYDRVGEPTEAALKVLAEKLGVDDAKVMKGLEQRRLEDPAGTVTTAADWWASRWNKLATLEFSRDRKSMSVIVRPAKGRGAVNRLLVKGAPEGILARCTRVRLADGSDIPLDENGRRILLAKVEGYAQSALRCLALAVKEGEELGPLANYDGERSHPAHGELTDTKTFAKVESDLTFVGLAGMLDPPRPEVKPAIATCKLAGVRVVVITGDNKSTAESVCRKIGIFEEDEDLSKKSFTGSEFMALSREKQDAVLGGVGGRVFSRTEPRHKMELVKMLKGLGDVCAMTGDGVNDAPALKQADIGIAMGITGTEVAKQASDMVLADDNFATIVSAVEEGRAIYNNMQAFIRYLISSNIGEVAAIFFTAMLGLPEGLIPVQLLWVNLVTDGPPATALGFNPPDKDIMTKPPRNSGDVLINGWVFFRYMVVGVYVGIACVGVFAYWYVGYDDGEHTLVSWDQLTHWTQCPSWEDFTVQDYGGLSFKEDPCSYFTAGKVKASTLSLSVLVVIEMLNALNALSEDGSLVTMPPWVNPYLLVAMLVSFGSHALILYVPFMAKIFSVMPLNLAECGIVMAFSMPVLFIDEVLKLVGRRIAARELEARLAKNKSD